MEIVALTLLTPLLGIALLLCDANRQTALPVQSRSFWALVLRVVGSLTGLAGGVLIVAAILLVVNKGWPSISIFPLLGGLGVIAVLTGMKTFRLKQTWPGPNEDPDDGEVIDRYSTPALTSDPGAGRFRSGAWLLTLYPLLFILPLLGLFSAFLMVIGAIVLSSFVQSRRSFQSQLLWLLAIGTRNRLPIADELRSLSVDRGVSLKKRLLGAAQDLDHGDTLSMAMERHRLLPAATVAAIRVSEGGSRLEETLRRLAIQSTNRLKVFNVAQVGELLTQVFVLLAVGSTIVGGVMYFIIPKFKEIFIGFDVELPQSTQLLIEFSDHVVNTSSEMFFWLGMLFALLVWHAMRHIIGWSSLPFPIPMLWFPKRDTPEVLRALGGIAREQVSIPEKLLLLVNRPGRPDLGARYQRVAASLSAGETLSNALWGEGLLTRIQREAVAAGERGGNLEFVLFSMAEALDRREYRSGAYWAELARPIAVVVCGAITAFIAIAMFMPLVKLLAELS